MEKNDDMIPVQPLAAWELAVNKPLGLILLRLHSLEDPQAPLEDAKPHPRVVLSAAGCLKFAHDLLSALRKLQEGGEAPPAQPRLQGSEQPEPRSQ